MSERFFPATAMNGQLFIQGMGPSWDSGRLTYWNEEQVDLILQPLAEDRKVRTEEELLAALKQSQRGLPTIKVWIHEGLENVAQNLVLLTSQTLGFG